MHAWLHWFDTHRALAGAFAVASLVLLLAAMVALPVVLVRLPEDALLPSDRRAPRHAHPVRRALAAVGRNVLGWLLVGAGIAMLVLPGQGLLTILLGLLLVDVPGKRRIVLGVLERPAVWRGLNGLRTRAGRPPLRWPEPDA